MTHSACRYLAVLAAFGAITQPVAAQLPRDTWVAAAFDNFITKTGGGGLFLVSADRKTKISISNPTPNMAGANAVVADGAGMIYYGTIGGTLVQVPNPGEIFSVLLTVSGNTATVISEVRLTTGSVGYVNGLALRGDEIWYADGDDIGFIPRVGGAATVRVSRATAGIAGLFQSITTDGRHVFFGTSHNSANRSNVWALDANDPSSTVRGVALCTSFFSSAHSVWDMNLGRDGHVFAGCIGGALFSVDPTLPHDPANSVINSGTQLNATRAPQSNANGASLNPWTNIAGVVAGYGSTTRQLDHFDVAAGTWFSSPVGLLGTGVPSNVTSGTELPFELFGKGCAGSNSKELRSGWTGLPLGGQKFDLTLRDAEQGLGMLLIGLSNTTGPFGPLPFNLNSILSGAPLGCNLLVSWDMHLSTTVTGAGTAKFTIPMPTNPTLNGVSVFTQWAVIGFSSGVISVSDGVHIRPRT
ncbi:MAG: hypothetical protein VX951_05520 [Planctomycetota bacterium]|nr:hypothetical protein [Planctomycetota bacterium]